MSAQIYFTNSTTQLFKYEARYLNMSQTVVLAALNLLVIKPEP